MFCLSHSSGQRLTDPQLETEFDAEDRHVVVQLMSGQWVVGEVGRVSEREFWRSGCCREEGEKLDRSLREVGQEKESRRRRNQTDRRIESRTTTQS